MGEGSSPRVRGKPGLNSPTVFAPGLIPACAGKTNPHPLAVESPGLIPACAGKTNCSSIARAAATAHPRVCGENLPRLKARTIAPGSSPRVRGKHDARGDKLRRDRLIPACAGKTRGAERRSGKEPAHPRVCGENVAVSSRAMMCSGSSPRVRGKRMFSSWSCTTGGLIPACAGKT